MWESYISTSSGFFDDDPHYHCKPKFKAKKIGPGVVLLSQVQKLPYFSHVLWELNKVLLDEIPFCSLKLVYNSMVDFNGDIIEARLEVEFADHNKTLGGAAMLFGPFSSINMQPMEKKWIGELHNAEEQLMQLRNIVLNFHIPSQDAVLQSQTRLFIYKTNCDVTFKLKGEDIKGHIALLADRSPVFSAMFEHNFIEKSSKIVEINDIRPVIFKQLLEYIYTGLAPKMENEDVTMDLLKAADKYQVASLRDECSIVLGGRIKLENAVSMLIFSDQYGLRILYENTEDFIAENRIEICSSAEWMYLMKHHPELCYQATRKIAAFTNPCGC